MANKRGKELGLDQTITRRDFVYGSSLLVGGALSGCATGGSQEGYGFDVGKSWYGPGGVGDYAPSHGNTPGVVGVAHEIRSGRFKGPLVDASDSGERRRKATGVQWRRDPMVTWVRGYHMTTGATES